MEHMNLNNDWKYCNNFNKDMIRNDYDDSSMANVRLPHCNVETPFNYIDEKIYQTISCYRKKLEVREVWKGKQVLLTFEGIGHVATVYLNGIQLTKHCCGYTAFTVDLNPYLNYASNYKLLGTEPPKEDNVLVVEVDSRETNNVPPFGNVIDYLTYGGIYREASLDIKESVSIEDVFIMTAEVNSESEDSRSLLWRNKGARDRRVDIQVMLRYREENERLRLKLNLTDAGQKSIYRQEMKITGNMVEHRFIAEGIKLWELEEPVLYRLDVELTEDRDNGRTLDKKSVSFGFRTCEFKEDGFYLNRKKVKLIGLNRHQSFPYVGYAMPKSMQRLDAEILKKELKVNAVRTSHYPQSKHFIDRCDELGLLVFTEIPGWQHIGGEEWKEIACKNVREMIMQYRNHPSVILWGVRINESQDDDAFYTTTNQIAHELDPTRQTGGVRFLKKSSFLEDVYTYNDFIHNGKNKGLERKKAVASDKMAPYLVTEFNGHMYPTKAYDSEEHRLEHALRHAKVLDAAFGQKGVAGAFGWCMFDYNTHKDFGSGDRICYHGVMDMFRNPKLAAAVYASQKEEEAVCEISSSLDIGDHPAGDMGNVYVFTNADSVRLYKDNLFIREFFPDKKNFPDLPHPPIVIDDFIGDMLESREHFRHRTAETVKKLLLAVKKYGINLPLCYKVQMAALMVKEHLSMEAAAHLYYRYISSWGVMAATFSFEAVKDGKVTRVIYKRPSDQPKLVALTSSTVLKEEETYDASAVRIRAVDGNGNLLPYYQEPIRLTAWGAVSLIGPSTISLKGGMAGTYVKTNGIKGEGGLKILQEDLGELELKFTVQ